MTQEQKQKFIELSKLTKEKGCPNSYVYVGKGLPEALPFGKNLIATVEDFRDWSNKENNSGALPYWEYACPVSLWEETIGQKYSCRPVSQKLPIKFFIKTHTPALSTAVQGKLFEFGYCWRGGGQDVRHPEQKYLYIDKKSLHYSYNNQYNPEFELSLDVLFSLELIKELTISGILPQYEITVTESGLEAAGIKIDWTKWEEIRGFLNQKFDWRPFVVNENSFIRVHNEDISKGVQKRLFELGYYWSEYAKEYRHTNEKFLCIKKCPNNITFSDGSIIKDYKEITLDELFKDNKLSVMCGPEFEKGRYGVFAREEGPSFGCQKLKSWDKWRELEAKVEQFKLELK